MITLGTVAFAVAAYVLIWNPIYNDIQSQILTTTSSINDPYIQSQMLVPIAMRELLPAGLLGLFAIFMIGSSVSTDDSAYHSWGSIFLQDVIMPFRKKPFSTKEHLTYLRWSIVLIGIISFIFSSLWTMKDFINMWFEITAAIYVGGASCAIIGGLYWKKGTTAGAWAGLISGSLISVGSIILKQIYPNLCFPGSDVVINGIHMAVFAVFVSYIIFFIVSQITCKKPFNMEKLLNRGKYKKETSEDDTNHENNIPKTLKILGITKEFSKSDKVIYLSMIIWTIGWSLTFIVGTIYNLSIRQLSSEEWKFWWFLMLSIQGIVSLITAIWFTVGGAYDTKFLFEKLSITKINKEDDGMVLKEN